MKVTNVLPPPVGKAGGLLAGGLKDGAGGLPDGAGGLKDGGCGGDGEPYEGPDGGLKGGLDGVLP